MAKDKLLLDCVYEHEIAQPERIDLAQPIGGGRAADCTCAQLLDLTGGLGRGDPIAIMSRNCVPTIPIQKGSR